MTHATAISSTALFAQLLNDENGFIVSAELVLIATIAVMGLIVGLSEVAFNINQELEDVGSAFGSINQTYRYNGTTGKKGFYFGSSFGDMADDGDDQCDISCNATAEPEG